MKEYLGSSAIDPAYVEPNETNVRLKLRQGPSAYVPEGDIVSMRKKWPDGY